MHHPLMSQISEKYMNFRRSLAHRVGGTIMLLSLLAACSTSPVVTQSLNVKEPEVCESKGHCFYRSGTCTLLPKSSRLCKGSFEKGH